MTRMPLVPKRLPQVPLKSGHFHFWRLTAGLPDPLPPFTYTGSLNISEVAANVTEEKGANEDSMVLTE